MKRSQMIDIVATKLSEYMEQPKTEASIRLVEFILLTLENQGMLPPTTEFTIDDEQYGKIQVADNVWDEED